MKDPAELTPQTQARLAREILALKAATAPRPWEAQARNKQLWPDHPRHHLPWTHPRTGKVYTCGCDGPHEDWTTWIFMAGRGCVAGHTKIYLPLEDRHERIDRLAARGLPVTVLALTGNGPAPVRTDGAPFFKGIAGLYEVTTDDGCVITVTDQHRFLTPQGWRRLADVRAGQLLASGAPVPARGAEFPSASPSGALHSTRTAAGSADRYPRYRRCGDQSLLRVLGNGQALLPSPAGADVHSLPVLHEDAPGFSPGCTRPHQPNSRRARNDYAPVWPFSAGAAGPSRQAAAGQFPRYIPARLPSPGTTFPSNAARGSGIPAAGAAAQRTAPAAVLVSSGAPAAGCPLQPGDVRSSDMTPQHQQLSLSGSPPADNGYEFPLRSAEAQSWSTACLDAISWTRVAAVRPAGTGIFYDMHVPGAENYAAEGLWHHNTGKTLAGAQWSLAMALSEPGIYVGVCAPTYVHVRKTCFEDLQSGIEASALPGEITDVNKNNLQITLRNGSIIQGFSAENADSVRGANLSYAWFDELAMIKFPRFFDYGLKPALRIKPKKGDPRLMITTTPTKLRLIRDLVEQAEKDPRRFHITTAASEENPYFSEGALEDLRRQYRGTYLEQQELEGRLVLDADGALFSIEEFCEHRVYPGEEPDFRRIVVAIDPATTSTEASDETGIVVAAEGVNGHFYTLEDLSLRGTPKKCMEAVAAAYHRWDADLVVGEKNAVGDYMPELLAKEDANIPFKSVPAMKGKLIRAEPISHLAAAGRVHMVGEFELLERQLAAMTPDIERSRQHDDRADAWVWALTELSKRSAGSFRETYGFITCPSCGGNVSQYLDRACRHCGEPVARETERPGHDRATRWAAAYLRTCRAGHEYPATAASCPHCAADPASYLARVAGLSGPPGAAYTPRNWLAGRRI